MRSSVAHISLAALFLFVVAFVVGPIAHSASTRPKKITQRIQSFLPAAERRKNLGGAIVKGSGPDLFVIEHGLRRHIVSMEVLRAFHFEHRRIELLTDADLALLPNGDPLGLYSSWPDETLLQGSGPRVFMVLKNVRRWIPNETTFRAWGLYIDRITTIADAVLSQKNESAPLIGKPPPQPDTTILTGPTEGSVNEQTSVTFTFTGTAGDGTRNVNFETYLEGFDSQWVPTTRTERSFDFERKDAHYRFFVRAISNDGGVDETPASVNFSARFSPFGKYVRMSSVASFSTSPDDEVITIDVASASPTNIDLTEYAISNDRGFSFHLPRVENSFRAGEQLLASDPLVIPPGGRVLVTIGKTPLKMNVRLNRCMRYLNRNGSFLNQFLGFFSDCPQPPQEMIDREAGKVCSDYLKTFSACTVPNPIPYPDNVRLGNQCVSFISRHYTYNGCLDDHQSERDFFAKEWRVEIGLSQKFFPTGKEIVELRDRDGKIVDRYKPFF